MLTVCPNCRHPYQNELHSVCQPCCESEVNCNIPVVENSNRTTATSCGISNNFNAAYDLLLKQQRIRNVLSGGTFLCDVNLLTDSRNEKCDKSKIRKDCSHSPTASLSLLLPSTVSLFATCSAFSKVDENIKNSFYNSEEDLKCIAASQKYLKLSGWYHQTLSWNDSVELLMPTSVGTFLIRDSSDSKYLYSLSVQTKCGPTSIRIHYANGEFRLDADHNVAKFMPRFSCIIKLIQHYIETTKNLPLKCSQDKENQIWIECIGKIYSQVVVAKPLYAKDYFPSLKHLSRLCVNKYLLDSNFSTVLPAPSFLINYLQEYPYKY